MTGTSTLVGASMLAHGVHVALVLLGLWGLAALLLPQALERRHVRHQASTTLTVPPVDEHVRRVTELRAVVAAGSLLTQRPTSPPRVVVAGPPQRAEQRALGLPLAVVASAAAAGIHGAVAPAHLADEPLFGVFFLAMALAQVWWVAALASCPRAGLLRVGIVLNTALIALWLVTRVVGLPFGLLPEPHPVGGWDVICVGWQLLIIASCSRMLPAQLPARLPGWWDWHTSTRAAVGAAVVMTALLTIVGAHS